MNFARRFLKPLGGDIWVGVGWGCRFFAVEYLVGCSGCFFSMLRKLMLVLYG